MYKIPKDPKQPKFKRTKLEADVVFRTVWCSLKADRHTDQQNRVETVEVNPQFDSQLILNIQKLLFIYFLKKSF